MASKLKNAGSVMLTSLGEKALPYVQDAMQGLIDRMPAITETLGGVIERAGPMFGVRRAVYRMRYLPVPLWSAGSAACFRELLRQHSQRSHP